MLSRAYGTYASMRVLDAPGTAMTQPMLCAPPPVTFKTARKGLAWTASTAARSVGSITHAPSSATAPARSVFHHSRRVESPPVKLNSSLPALDLPRAQAPAQSPAASAHRPRLHRVSTGENTRVLDASRCPLSPQVRPQTQLCARVAPRPPWWIEP